MERLAFQSYASMSTTRAAHPFLWSWLFPLSGRLPATLRRRSPEKVHDLLPTPFTVLRLLTPLKMSYEAAQKRAETYTKIMEALPEMRQDTVEPEKKAVKEKRHARILVNDRSEGNGPLTIQALKRVSWNSNHRPRASVVVLTDPSVIARWQINALVLITPSFSESKG